MDIRAEREFYLDQLRNNILPFWFGRPRDAEYGGVYTCISNTGDSMISTDKYTWSQGRMLWLLSRVFASDWAGAALKREAHTWAEATKDFLMKHCLLENGHCSFLLTREGGRKLTGGVYDASAYADCFVVLGMCEYAARAGDFEALAFGERLYETTLARYEADDFPSAPYPVPRGMRAHGIPMIMTNTSRALADARKALGLDASRAEALAYGFAKFVLDTFVDADGVLHEACPKDGGFDMETVLGRYINPGHTIEDAWFMAGELAPRGEDLTPVLAVAKKALELGWDERFGGLRQYADCAGGAPKGEVGRFADEPMLPKLLENGESKLWWPHSEALYTTLMFGLRVDAEMLTWYERVKNYTFETFPNRENALGEWVQIRDRAGRPENRVVALPVKDPFHIARNMLLIIELLSGATK